MNSQRRVLIIGTGSYLPQRVLTNADLEKMVETSDEWIVTRSGIKERHIARPDEPTSEMCASAARLAIEQSGLSPAELGAIIVATITPDMPLPSTACFVQEKIGAKNAFCFDLQAACSGFLYGLEIARQFVSSGFINSALVIGAEKLSYITDWKDRSTCVLFGDGAGAVVVCAADTAPEKHRRNSRGIMHTVMGSDGALADLLTVPGGGTRTPLTEANIGERLQYIKMNGKEVFKHAVRCMCDAGQQVLDLSGLTINEISCVIPHQANIRIINAIAERFNNCIDKFYINLERVGNMSAASVPVAMDEAVRKGRIKNGDKVLLIVFGGGFTWGAMTIEW
jgi:3-oxoacyl-[acyl-carrier-protein] synthase-3